MVYAYKGLGNLIRFPYVLTQIYRTPVANSQILIAKESSVLMNRYDELLITFVHWHCGRIAVLFDGSVVVSVKSLRALTHRFLLRHPFRVDNEGVLVRTICSLEI